MARRGGKKRIQPTFLGSSGSPAPPSQAAFVPPQQRQGAATSDLSTSIFAQPYESAINGTLPPSHTIQTASGVYMPPHQPQANDEWQMYPSETYPVPSSYHADLSRTSPPMVMDNDRPGVSAYNDNSKGRRKTNDMDVDIPRGRARTLGGDYVRETRPVRELRPDNDLPSGSGPTNVRFRDGFRDHAHILSIPSIKTFLSVRVEGTEDVLEGANFDNDRA